MESIVNAALEKIDSIKKEQKMYTRDELLDAIKKWDKESREAYSYADIRGLIPWFDKFYLK